LPEPALAFTRQGTEIDAELPPSEDAATELDADDATIPDGGGGSGDAKADPDPDPDASIAADAADPDAEADPPDSHKPACQCGPDEDCVDGECVRVRWTFEAEDDVMTHETGARTDVGWGAWVLVDSLFAFLQRGPYVAELPAGTYEAFFYIRVGFFLADVEAATIDVNDYDGEPDGCLFCLLASRTIRTADIAAAGAFQTFKLRFENPGDRRLEFRVFFIGFVDLEVDRVEVLRIVDP
jgi:hypothetical protein